MAANAINAANAIDSLTAADGSIRNRFGKPTHQANKPPPNLPPPTAAAAKPSCAISKKTQTQAQFAAPARANVIMDTTYFGRRFGIMVLFDSISRKALSVTEVKTETNTLYAQEIGSLKAKGIEIQSIMRRPQRHPADFPRHSRTTLPLPPSPNRPPLLNAQPENGSGQRTVAVGTDLKEQPQSRL